MQATHQILALHAFLDIPVQHVELQVIHTLLNSLILETKTRNAGVMKMTQLLIILH